jgi:hypothetical protein
MLGQPKENYVGNNDVVSRYQFNTDDYDVIQLMTTSCADATTMSFHDVATTKAMQ